MIRRHAFQPFSKYWQRATGLQFLEEILDEAKQLSSGTINVMLLPGVEFHNVVSD